MLLLTYPSNSYTQTYTLEFVKEGCRANDHWVRTGMGHLTCRAKPLYPREDYVAYEANIFFAFKGEKMRYDSERFFSKTHLFSKRRDILKQAFDGEKTIEYKCTYYPDEGTIFPGGSIKGSNAINMDNLPINYGIAFYSESLGDLLSHPEAELIGTDTVNSEVCYRVKTWSGDLPIEILVNGNRGFRAQEIRALNPQGAVQVMISISLDEFEGGIWFPRAVKIQFPTSVREITVDHDFKVNISVPDELFIIDFPSGVPVYDFRIDKSFIAK